MNLKKKNSLQRTTVVAATALLLIAFQNCAQGPEFKAVAEEALDQSLPNINTPDANSGISVVANPPTAPGPGATTSSPSTSSQTNTTSVSNSSTQQTASAQQTSSVSNSCKSQLKKLDWSSQLSPVQVEFAATARAGFKTSVQTWSHDSFAIYFTSFPLASLNKENPRYSTLESSVTGLAVRLTGNGGHSIYLPVKNSVLYSYYGGNTTVGGIYFDRQIWEQHKSSLNIVQAELICDGTVVAKVTGDFDALDVAMSKQETKLLNGVVTSTYYPTLEFANTGYSYLSCPYLITAKSGSYCTTSGSFVVDAYITIDGQRSSFSGSGGNIKADLSRLSPGLHTVQAFTRYQNGLTDKTNIRYILVK